MSKNSWTDSEKQKLRFMYVSSSPFEDIEKALPKRSANAIRLKASRLGLKRPTDSTSSLEPSNVLQFSDRNGESGLFFRCVGCGNWIKGYTENEEASTLVCSECKSVCRYAA
jgi:hypothetical protein